MINTDISVKILITLKQKDAKSLGVSSIKTAPNI